MISYKNTMKIQGVCYFLLFLMILDLSSEMVVPPARPSSDNVRLVLGSTNYILANYSVVRDDNEQLKNGIWCQSFNNKTTSIGTWYDPSNNEVMNEKNLTTGNQEVLSVIHSQGQIGLFLEDSDYTQGLYKCVILDGSNVNRTLIVGIFKSNYNDDYNDYNDDHQNDSQGDIEASDIQFSLLTEDQKDADPPVFMFTFTVTNQPPANVSCTLGDVALPITLTRQILESKLPTEVLVQVTISTRQSGQYECTVNEDNNEIDAENMETTVFRNVTVTNPPLDLMCVKLNAHTVNLTWSGQHSSVKGYEIYFQDQNGAKESVEVKNDNKPPFFLKELRENMIYIVFVVAFGEDLPSKHSNVINITTTCEFQICSQSIASCKNLPIQMILFVKQLFKNATVKAVRESCQCNFNEYFITNDTVSCFDTPSPYLMFKANVKSFSNQLKADQILLIIDQWLLDNETTISTGLNNMTFMRQCSISSNNNTFSTIESGIITNTPSSHLKNSQDITVAVAVVGSTLLCISIASSIVLLVTVAMLRNKYQRLKQSKATKNLININSTLPTGNFEMMECDAYCSSEETIKEANKVFNSFKLPSATNDSYEMLGAFPVIDNKMDPAYESLRF